MAKQEVSVELKPIKIESFQVTLIGDSPLICHKWSEKAKKEKRDDEGRI